MIYENNALKRILIEGGYFEGGTYYFYLTDHLGNNRVVAKGSGTIVQTNHYYPYGMSFAEGTQTSSQPYKFGNKELDTQKGLNWYDFEARWKDDWSFSTMDPLAEKYYSISPYAYVANNPLRYIDLKGDSISVVDLYARDKQGNLINQNQVKTFEFLASTKEGKALLANYAAKGQTIAGVTFKKNGNFHKEGINISFGTKVSRSISSGTTSFTLDEKNMNIQVGVAKSSDIGDLLDTFVHEIAIHADQFSADFIDDKVVNNSNAYPALRKMNRSRGYTQHWQERNVNKAMERIGLPIMQQYYKSQRIVKSNDATLKLIYGFLNN
ncbi:RHS repeat domain-containing protein [Bacteroides sp. UBA939]|uniref:RHS repeat domain-containing protein n=1 Tax=Bacteroides sp. UBA939 TaxID=1946092 RepID=UPI0025BCAC94|nr:RHS repeat-associated core domain-containing protein [Bacteroides sp. UBA939]